MFERFTDPARRAVARAQEEARSFDHNYIGTEHLLAALSCEGRGAAARTLEPAGITVDAVRGKIETLIGRGQEPLAGHIPFTPQAKKCLELSLREALNLGHNHIGTGHLLLGLISQDDGVAVKVLRELGADLAQLRAQVIVEIEGQQEGLDYSPPLRMSFPVRLQRAQLSAVQGLLDTIDNRLTSIELHLGITRPGPDAETENVVPPS
jgi:ATP-dependent Clp protease ATP-binding subunit ClpC